jgi:hypothetical protein
MATTNKLRGLFIQICKKVYMRFEGGFFYVKNVEKNYPQYSNYLIEYKDFIYKKRLSPNKYIKNTKKSNIVFNTPSVGGCHGWKLCEYFAMGKAIISMPLNNMMPTHAIPILLVEDINNLEHMILTLKNDNELRRKLEEKSYEYFNTSLAPKVVIERIMEKLNSLI